MRVLGLKGLSRKDSPLSYRSEYAGTAVLDLEIDQTIERRFTFVLEHSATGSIAVSVNLVDDINYPLVPVLNSLKSHILMLEKEGKLS